MKAAIGEVIGVCQKLAYMTPEEIAREIRRMDRKIRRLELQNADHRKIDDAYYERYIIRKYAGNPSHLRVYED